LRMRLVYLATGIDRSAEATDAHAQTSGCPQRSALKAES